MIVVRITGGMGNQLFQYSMGRALSIKIGTELVLDTSFYESQDLRDFELDKFSIKARYADVSDLKAFFLDGGIFSKVLRKTKIDKFIRKNYIKEEKSIALQNNVISFEGSGYFDGYWQNPEYFSQFRDVLLKELTPKIALSNNGKELEKEIVKTNSVSLHIRRGDYVTNSSANLAHGVCSIEYYKKAIEYIDMKLSNPVYFVFSDDIEWCKKNINTLGELHFVDDTETSIDDLVLMSRCKHHIIANSTFSWWGAWLSDSNITIAPKQWFSDASRCDSSLFPVDWILI